MTRTAQNNAGGGLQTSNYFSLLGSKKVGKSSSQPSNQAKKPAAQPNASQQKQPQERGDQKAHAKQKTSQHVMSLDNTVVNDNPKKEEDKKKTSAQIKKEKEEKDHHVDRSTKGRQTNKGGVGAPHNEKDLIAEGQDEITQQENADTEEKKENRNRKPKKEEPKPEEEEDPTKDYVTYDDFIKQKTTKNQVDTGLLQKQRKVNATNLKGMAKKDNGKHTEETYMVIPQKKEQTQPVQQPAKKGAKAPVVTEKEKKKPQHNQELFQKMFWMPPKVQRSYEPRKDVREPKKEEGEQQGGGDNQQPNAEGEATKPEETQPENTENTNTTENTETWGDAAWGGGENNTKETKAEAGEAVDNNNNNNNRRGGDYDNRGRGRGGRGRGGRSYNNYEGGRGYEGRGYEGRGYEGRGRGGRGRGGGRNFQRTEPQSTPNLGDNDAFPSLGGK